MKYSMLIISAVALIGATACTKKADTTAANSPVYAPAGSNAKTADQAADDLRRSAEQTADAIERDAKNVASATKKQANEVADATRESAERTADAMERAGNNVAANVADSNAAINARLTEWNLSSADIRRDYEKSTRIVRNKLSATSNTVARVFDDPRVVASINGKYLKDADLSSRKIDVDAEKGVVVLKGTVKNQDQIGRAMVMALDTDGVTQVISELIVQP